MATVRATIKLAMRKLGVLGLNRAADAGQEAEAGDALNRLIVGWLGFGASHPVIPIRVESSYTVSARWPAQRLLLINGGLNIELPENPVDGARVGLVDVNGNGLVSPSTLQRSGMLIAGVAADVSLNTANFNRLYMFRAELGDWKLASNLAVTDDLPFPAEFDDDIARLLAFDCQSLFEKELPPFEARRVTPSKAKLRARYVKPMPMTPDGAISSLGGASWPGIAQSLTSQDFD